MKKVLALVLSAMMVLALVGTAMASTVGLTTDASVQITGLDEGDTVYLYQVLTVDSATGKWKLTSAFEALNDSSDTKYSENIHKIVENTAGYTATLTKADVEKITALAKNTTETTHGNADASGKYTYDTSAAAGMYLALVAPVNAEVVYNPIIISADYKDNDSNSINASTAKLGGSTVSKKEKVTLEKQTEDLTLDAGEIVMFTVTTVIPAYADSYVNPKFNVSDTLSAGLEFVVDTAHPFTVSSGEVTYTGAPATGDTTFTLVFNSEKIAALTTPQNVTITYYAKLTSNAPYTVNEEQNDVTVEFSNDPKDDTSHGHLKDIVKEYTFTIDGSLFGHSSWKTSELVKVGLDADGKPIESVVNESNGSAHAALEGAVFGLYTTESDAENDTNRYTNTVFTTGTVTTDAKGLMEIKGLDEGTYYFKEISAPNGYIKDPAVHKFEIKATFQDVTYTETLPDHCVVTYTCKVLKSYTVTVDDTTASTYTADLIGPSVTIMSSTDLSSEIVNTKGLELPSTGGIGTTIFYVAGLMMVLGASAILVARRKADAE